MKKFIFFCCCIALLSPTANPAWAMHEKSSETRVEDLSTRIGALEKSVSENEERFGWLDRVSTSGLLEVEAGYEKYKPDASGETGTETSDIVLATMELGLDARLNEYISGHVLFLWEEDDTEPVDLDEGFITIFGTERLPLYLLAGKYCVPFGKFESYFISDPLTLELGETNQSAVMCGYHHGVFDINAGLFNGDVNKIGKKDHARSVFASAAVSLPEDFHENLNLTAGVSYISNIADTSGLSGRITDADGDGEPDGVSDYVAGISGFVSVGIAERVFCVAEIVSALDKFNEGELGFADGKRRPKAWNLEIAYVSESNMGAGLKYEGADDCGYFLSKSGYGGIIFWYPFEKTYVGLEYLNQDFENDDNVQKVTVQLAYEF